MDNNKLKNLGIISFSFFSTLLTITSPSLSEPQLEVETIQINSSFLSNSDAKAASKPSTTLTSEDLKQKDTTSLGAALQNELGVANTSFAQGAGRPIIRGLGGDRIRVLENGLGTNDVSASSPDHPVNVELNDVESIEILRGPSALRFGTSAVGGVVNVTDNKIPDSIPDGLVTGSFNTRGASNNLLRSAGFHTDAAVSDNVVFHLDSSALMTSDSRAGEDFGRVRDSDLRTNSVSFGGSYIEGKSFLGVAGSYLNSNYGVPISEEDISIDMRQPKIDIRGKLDKPTEFLESITLNSNISDYQHTEMEGAEVGTVFKNKGSDSRLEFNHKPILKDLSGTFGLQVQTSRFSAIGEEAYQVPTDTDVYSAYLIENYSAVKDLLNLSGGVRFDSQSTTTDLLERNFDTFSKSLSADLTPVKDYAIGLSVSRTERAPIGQELFANGPHAATGVFEIGDASLRPEQSLGIDLALKKTDGAITGSIGGFSNYFSNFINLTEKHEGEHDEDEEHHDEEEHDHEKIFRHGDLDDLPEYQFLATKAQFYGIESRINFHFFGQTEKSRISDDLTFFVQQDWVWANNPDTDSPIERTTPFRLKTGIKFQREDFGVILDMTRTNAQNRVAEEESKTAGFNFVNLYVSKDVPELGFGNNPAQLFIRGENLTDEFALNHVSFLRDSNPLPGRNVTAGIRLDF